jgi:Transglutaminase-like superfamily
MTDDVPTTAQASAPRAPCGLPAREDAAGGLPPAEGVKNRHPLFRAAWYTVNVLLILAILLAAYSVAWEYSTRRYLKGFSDAIVPKSGSSSAQEKIEAILDWMAHGPARRAAGADISTPDRDPTDTLNYARLLQICGSVTNAFINLADATGLPARRLLLLDSHQMTKHVVAEVRIGGRWIVVDPAFRQILRGPDGQLLTRKELADPAVFSAATRDIPNYSPDYTYDRTAHIRMSRIRYVGLPLQHVLNRLLPGWESSAAMSLVPERESLVATILAVILVLFLALLRVVLRWYGEKRLRLRLIRFREQFRRACYAFLDTAG